MKLEHSSILQSFFQATQITVALGLAFLIYPNSHLNHTNHIYPEITAPSILLESIDGSWEQLTVNN